VTTLLGLVDALLELVEPAAAVQPAGLPVDMDRAESGSLRDRTAAEPFTYDDFADTVFAFETDDVRLPFGTQAAQGIGEDLVRFAVQLVYVAGSGLEEAAQRRSRAVSEAIDDRRQLYVARVRAVRSGADWSHLQASADVDYVRSWMVRGFALRLTGWYHDAAPAA
jgi:hypothetical protein